ncbi:MAG TPA: beta-galactosidase [bacterium]|nr:beta-galactosidase [bacterium]
MKKLLLLTILFISTNPLAAASPSFFTVTLKNNKAWFLSPSGKQFLSMGVNAIGDQSYRAPNAFYYNPVKNQFSGDKAAWVKSALARLKKWGFNTIGSWSDEDLLGKKVPYTYMLYIARGNPWERVLDSVFSPEFEALVKENAKKAAKYKDDPDLIGYFLDNEMPWWGEYGWKAEGQKSLLEKYAAGAIENPNKQVLKKFFEDRYDNDIDRMDDAWALHLSSFDELLDPVTLTVRTKKQKADASAWAGVVADRYFAVTTKALKEVDPNHLILGVRFAGENPWEVVQACGKYCDMVSVNIYAKSGTADQVLLDNFYAKARKPILITEYSYSSMENQSGDPNTHGADVTVPTQKDRVEHLDRFARQLLALPYIVGLHWFEWSDESPKGRFDGEDQDYGLVDIQDKEYRLLTQKHAELNLAASSLHEKAEGPLPTIFKSMGEADYRRAEAGSKIDPVRPYLKIDGSLKPATWGDDAQSGKVTTNTSSGVVEINFESGSGWGCGISLPPNAGPFVAPNVVDLRGYNFFQFKAFVPKDLGFVINMGEAGSADPSSSSFNGVSGSDGESYTFPPFQGTGKWETYRVNLSDLEHRTVWGNQHGNNLFDTQAVSVIDFYIPGNQGAGKMLVKDLEFRVR